MTRFNPYIVLDSTDRPTSPKFIDRTGERYGRLVFEAYAGKHNRHSYWWVRCDCGTRLAVFASSVSTGNTSSCGCLHSSVTSRRFRTHGDTGVKTKTPEYACWVQIKTRCFNENYVEFHLYGGRGITMAEHWRKDFAAFLNDLGRRPSPQHSIDRIDPNGNYEPGNCRWATPKEQANNRRPDSRSHERPHDAKGRFCKEERP